jgi:hypothetical protein
MAQAKPSPSDYFAALQQILNVQQEVLTRVLPHSGERGSNTEEYFRQLLRRTLPHRYSIGTGFLICSTPDVEPSFQTDIVIYDEFYNTPLFRELAASVFPVEIVYGCIEVKGTLQSKDIERCVEASARIRRLGKEKKYIDYSFQNVLAPDGNVRKVLAETEVADTLAPRTFVVAYDTDFAQVESLERAWADALRKHPDAHLHGCVVLKKDWYLQQLAYGISPVLVLQRRTVLLHFVTGLLTGVSSLNMRLANMKRYFQDDLSSPLLSEPHHEPD